MKIKNNFEALKKEKLSHTHINTNQINIGNNRYLNAVNVAVVYCKTKDNNLFIRKFARFEHKKKRFTVLFSRQGIKNEPLYVYMLNDVKEVSTCF